VLPLTFAIEERSRITTHEEAQRSHVAATTKDFFFEKLTTVLDNLDETILL
jgi:hypothetical protein